MSRHCLIFIFFIIVLAGCNEKDDPVIFPDEVQVDWESAADSSSFGLFYSYWNTAEKYFNYGNNGNSTFHYWPQAHALDVMIDAWERTGDLVYSTTIHQWFEGVKVKNSNTFLNDYYDDMEWNALAMLRAYNSTGDEKFRTATLELWQDIQTGWNSNAGGGIAWKKDQLYSKNACSNGPACILAARLFQQFDEEADREWALKIYDWEKEYLFNPSNGAVYDNIDSRTGYIQTAWIFTYNQGTFLGSALELYKITGEKAYLNDALKAADYTISTLIDGRNKILKSEGEGDGGLFKGIFIRYFTQLIMHPDLTDAVRKRYIAFIEHNAETLWNHGTNKSLVLFGPEWNSIPTATSDLTTQISGAMLIEAVALLKNEGFIAD